MKVFDRLPHPQTYLRAGLPRPNTAHQSRDQLFDVIDHDDVRAATAAGSDQPSGGQAHTVLGEDGLPASLLWSRSHQYLARPGITVPAPEPLEPLGRHPSGALHVSIGEWDPINRKGRPQPPDLDTCRVVTLDTSVGISRLDPRLFDKNDAIFVSMALAIDLAVAVTTDPNGREGLRFCEWRLTQPVPVDVYVLYICQFMMASSDALFRNQPLDRTDLLIAATALHYEAPLYTRNPEAYAGIGNGLRLIEYGPVRNPDANAAR